MSETPISDIGAADPTTEEFWAACESHQLKIQKCIACGGYQHYPRPFCLTCESTDVTMVAVSGKARIYSVTTVRIPVSSALTPPYLVALVDLVEGPRLLTNIMADTASIGDLVKLDWREREGLPAVPVFVPENT